MRALRPGDPLGRYRIEHLLAEGGMGRVYRAHDPVLGRAVALKVLTATAAPGSLELARMIRGARAAAAFAHPNACPIYDAGEVDGQPYLAMELLAGPSLDVVVASSPRLGDTGAKPNARCGPPLSGWLSSDVTGGAKAWNSSPLRTGLTGVVKSNLSRLPCCSKMNCENGL